MKRKDAISRKRARKNLVESDSRQELAVKDEDEEILRRRLHGTERHCGDTRALHFFVSCKTMYS